MRFLLTLVLFVCAVPAQINQLFPYDIGFDKTVQISIVNWQGKPAIVASWDPEKVGFQNYYTYPNSGGFVVFFEQTVKRVSLNLEACGFLWSGPLSPCAAELGCYPWGQGLGGGAYGTPPPYAWPTPVSPLQLSTSAPAPPLEYQPQFPSSGFGTVYYTSPGRLCNTKLSLVAMVFTVNFL